MRRLEGRCRRTTSSATHSAPRPDTRSRSRSAVKSWTCSKGLQGNGSRLRDPRKESVEHPATTSDAPVVVAEHVLVQVGLQMLGRDAVVDAADSTLHQRPEAFDRL